MPGFPQHVMRSGQFAEVVLRNDAVQLVVVPELGAKVTSLRNLRTGRERMWSPTPDRALFRNMSGDAFEKSTLVGWDECLPTIAPCQWNGRHLPDHGEVWSAPWRVQSSDSQSITTSIDLPLSPLGFTRTLRLESSTVVATYQLKNKNSATERFIWAMHPLLAIEDGDQLELPEKTRSMLADERWRLSLEFDAQPQCAKRFVREVGRAVLTAPHTSYAPTSLRRGEDTAPYRSIRAGVFNSRTGDRITFEWSATENDTLGLWLTRGGWHGHHHLAIEPTNATHDSLAVAAGELNHAGTIAAGQTLFWTVRIHLSP